MTKTPRFQPPGWAAPLLTVPARLWRDFLKNERTSVRRRDNSKSVRLARAISYLGFSVWATIFWFYPPVVFVSAVDDFTRYGWLIAVSFFGIMATVGVLTRIDIKIELPALCGLLLGPILYTATQFWLIAHPQFLAAQGGTPEQRYALTAFAILPALQLMPRIVMLVQRTQEMKRSSYAAERATEFADQTGVTITIEERVRE